MGGDVATPIDNLEDYKQRIDRLRRNNQRDTVFAPIAEILEDYDALQYDPKFDTFYLFNKGTITAGLGQQLILYRNKNISTLYIDFCSCFRKDMWKDIIEFIHGILKGSKFMDNELNIKFLHHIKNNKRTNQRKIAAGLGISLGMANALVQDAIAGERIRVEKVEGKGHFHYSYNITTKGETSLRISAKDYYNELAETVKKSQEIMEALRTEFDIRDYQQ